jgi:hypothetical protein
MTSATERLIDDAYIAHQRLTLRNAKGCGSCALAEHCDAYDSGVADCELFIGRSSP